MGRNRRGFTLVELMIVVVILSILAGISLLKYIDLRTTALTAAVTGDIESVTHASLNYYAEFEVWPPEAGPGQVPTGLGQFLPGGLSGELRRAEYVLDYDNVAPSFVGVSIITTDPKLQAKLLATYSSRFPYFASGGKITYLIAGPGGVF